MDISEQLAKAVEAQGSLSKAQSALERLKKCFGLDPQQRSRVVGALDNVVYSLNDVDQVVRELRGEK